MLVFLRYIAVFLTTIALCASVQYWAINKGFSPYAIGSSAWGFDNIVAFRTDGRFAKTARTTAVDDRFDVYMIGSSRLRDGLSPDTVKEITGQTAFNYGLSGLLAVEMAQIVTHLLEYKHPDTIIIGLDFFAFNDSKKPGDNMVLSDKLSLEDRIKLYLSIFSLKAVNQSLEQYKNNTNIMCFKNGFCEDTRFNSNEVAHYIRQGLENMGKPTDVLHDFHSYNHSMKTFLTMLDELQKRGTKVLFFHSPAHFDYQERLQEIGLLELYKSWKSDVNTLIISHGYSVWDFDVRSPATTQSYENSAPYFNDDIHYTKHFGDIILFTLLTSDADGQYKKFYNVEKLAN